MTESAHGSSRKVWMLRSRRELFGAQCVAEYDSYDDAYDDYSDLPQQMQKQSRISYERA